MTSSRKLLLAGASALAIAAGMARVNVAEALCVPVSGTITGNCTGYTNSGSIISLTNSGTISSTQSGIGNSGAITSLTNSGTISGSLGIRNGGGSGIGSLSNSGTISGFQSGISNGGTITTLTNSGTISGGTANAAIYNSGTITTLTNSGTIAAAYGITSGGTIGALTNSGTISGNRTAISNYGTGTIGALTNSGVIAGNIDNTSANGLTINGGTSGTFGTLTGYAAGTAGAITSTSADLTFATGSLSLNDDINVGSHTVYNTGATLQLTNARTITGSYSQSGGGLVIAVASSSSYGALAVSGNATVTGSAITISGSGLWAGETFTIVKAGGTGTYNSDTASVSGASGLTASVTTVGNALDVILASAVTPTIGPDPTPSSPGYTGKGLLAGGAAAGMGPALDFIALSNSPQALAFQNAVLVPLNALPATQQGAAIKQLAPLQVPPASQAVGQTTPVISAIEQHDLALNETDGSGAAAGSALTPYGLWGQMLGGMALRGSSSGADGYKSNDFGLVTGLDFHADADTTVGAAFSWVRGWSWGLGGSTGSLATIDSYQITGYGLHHWGPAFVDGQAGIGYNSFNQRRAIGFLGQMAHATYDGQQYLAKLGAGYDLPLESVPVTPLAGLRLLRAVSGGYTENGSAENLTIARRGVQSLTQDLGAKVSWTVATDIGALKPEAQLAWVHDYTQGPLATSGLMGGQVFTSSIARPAADGVRANVAATLVKSDTLTLRAEYEGELRPNYQSHTGMLKTTWGF
jgi:uncharacterized protein with beta-barrel porin domain